MANGQGYICIDAKSGQRSFAAQSQDMTEGFNGGCGGCYNYILDGNLAISWI